MRIFFLLVSLFLFPLTLVAETPSQNHNETSQNEARTIVADFQKQGTAIYERAMQYLKQEDLSEDEKRYLHEMQCWAIALLRSDRDKTLIESLEDFAKNLPNDNILQLKLKKYLAERKIENRTEPQAAALQGICYATNLKEIYQLLLPEESRLKDRADYLKQIQALADLPDNARLTLTAEKIDLSFDTAAYSAAEQPDTNPASFYNDALKEVDAVKPAVDFLTAKKIEVLYLELEYLKQTAQKDAVMKDLQERYVTLLKEISALSDFPITSRMAAAFAMDFVRTVPQLTWDDVALAGYHLTNWQRPDPSKQQSGNDAVLAGIAFLEAVIPVMEQAKNPVLQDKVESLTKIQRRFLLTAKPFELETVLLDGTKINVADYRGKYVLVDFWATWCPSCRRSFPNKVKQFEKYKDKDFVILAYSVDKDVAALRKYQEENKFPWLNGSSTLSIAAGLKDYEKFYGIWGIPTTYLLDKDGKVVFMQVESNNDQLNEALKKHLEKVAP